MKISTRTGASLNLGIYSLVLTAVLSLSTSHPSSKIANQQPLPWQPRQPEPTTKSTIMLSKVLCVIAAPVVLFAQLAHGVPVTSAAPFKGYTVIDIEWQLPIDPRNAASKTFTVTGTIQEAVAKMEAAHPGWNATFVRTLNPTKPGSSLPTNPERDHYVCNPNDGELPATQSGIYNGISYLRGLTTAAPQNNPKSCGRVSCTENSGIWWCNNNANDDKTITWVNIADSAQFVTDTCKDMTNIFTRSIHAWDFFKDEWSVAIHYAKC